MTAAAGGHRVAMTEQRLTGGICVLAAEYDLRLASSRRKAS